MAYITQADLEAVLGAETVYAIFADPNTGQINQTALNQVLRLASARVDSYLARVYPGPFPLTQVPPPSLVVDAALAWARAMAIERHPEYVKQYADKPRQEAIELSEGLSEAKEYLNDLLTSPRPTNAGGSVERGGPRLMTDDDDGNSNLGDF